LIEAKVGARLGEFQLRAEIKGDGTTCLAGKNGAGKTTLMRAIAGFLSVDEGYVRVGGTDVTNQPVEKRGVVLVTPATHIPHLGVDSHIVWGARIRGVKPPGGYVSKVKSDLGIDYAGTVGNLSRGMRQRVALATALISSPKAILVDEAFLGLNDRESFISTYRTLTKGVGIDLVFSSQDEEDGNLADNLFVMNDGVATPKR